MKIAILVEGKTEQAFKPKLQEFLKSRLARQMPKLDFVPCDGGLPTGNKLQRMVGRLLNQGSRSADAVIALTDVYPNYQDAQQAKAALTDAVPDENRFYVHVALHDFEAWLLPYWKAIQNLAGSNRRRPGNNPEAVNHGNPPAHRLAEVFRTGSNAKRYVKPRDAGRILKDADLLVSIHACPELKEFINRILALCGMKGEELIS